MIEGFNAQRCEQRNRQAALRYGIDTAPIHFLSEPDANGLALTFFEGKLPRTVDDALTLINAMLPEGAPALTANDVYIHYVEAANNNFISDRYMFLGTDTLRNIARDGAAGVAFMNSHRTGGMSTDAEFPFGKSFCGQFQRGTDAQGQPVERTLLGFYMLRGVKPNGDGAPSTDDLDRNIRGGTLFDVSVGLREGEKICDVCDEPVYGPETSCPHLPGTHYSMSNADKERQKQRGVPDGKASSTYRNGRLGEFSGVFDGAVRGAGFRKAVSLASRLHGEDLAAAREVYGMFGPKQEDGTESSLLERLTDSFTEALRRALGGKTPTQTSPAQDAELNSDAGARVEEDAEMEDNQEMVRLRQDSEELAALKTQQREKAADDFANEAVTKHKQLLPFGAANLKAFYLQLAGDDEKTPLASGSRVEQLKALFKALPGHKLTEEQSAADLPPGATTLENDADPEKAAIKQADARARAYAAKANTGGSNLKEVKK